MLQSAANATSVDAEGADVSDAKAPVREAVLDPAWRAGRKLTEARTQLGLSINEVAERIRVRPEFLKALEDMNVKLLPGKAYAVAFLRSYARELGIEEKAIVDQFQDECALSREDVQKPIRAPTSRPRAERPWLWAVALIAIAAGLVGWRALVTNVQAPGVGEAPVAQAAAPGTASLATPARVIEVRALTDAVLEARGPDGTVFLYQTLHAGEVYRPDASPGWTLHARDGAAFEVFVNGAPAGLLGTAGMPVLGRSIDSIATPEPGAAAAPPRS